MVFTAYSPQLPDEGDRADAGSGYLVQFAVIGRQERAADAIGERDSEAVGKGNPAGSLQLPGFLP
jgi:hypothetical protein